MTASRLPSPPPFVPTLTEVVAGGSLVPTTSVHQDPTANPSKAPVQVQPPTGQDLDGLMQRLQDDLAAHLALRLQQQAPQWAAEWARGLGPELEHWARHVLRDLQNAQTSPFSDPEKP